MQLVHDPLCQPRLVSDDLALDCVRERVGRDPLLLFRHTPSAIDMEPIVEREIGVGPDGDDGHHQGEDNPKGGAPVLFEMCEHENLHSAS